jgi:hypothetical protein
MVGNNSADPMIMLFKLMTGWCGNVLHIVLCLIVATRFVVVVCIELLTCLLGIDPFQNFVKMISVIFQMTIINIQVRCKHEV